MSCLSLYVYVCVSVCLSVHWHLYLCLCLCALINSLLLLHWFCCVFIFHTRHMPLLASECFFLCIPTCASLFFCSALLYFCPLSPFFIHPLLFVPSILRPASFVLVLSLVPLLSLYVLVSSVLISPSPSLPPHLLCSRLLLHPLSSAPVSFVLVSSSLCDFAEWSPGSGCHPLPPPQHGARPLHQRGAAAHRLTALPGQPATHLHRPAVRGAGARLRQH